MNRFNRKKKKDRKPSKKQLDQIKEIVEQEVTYMCPKRGLVTEVVKVQRLKPVTYKTQEYISSKEDSEQEDFDKDNPIYGTDEEPSGEIEP